MGHLLPNLGEEWVNLKGSGEKILIAVIGYLSAVYCVSLMGLAIYNIVMFLVR